MPRGISCPSFASVSQFTSPSQFNLMSFKICVLEPKGLSQGWLDPHTILQLNPKPETIYGKNMQPLINTTVDWRAEKGQAQAAWPRPGCLAPQLLSFRPTQLKPTSSGNQEHAAKRRWTTDDIPRPAGLGEAGRPHFSMPHVQPSSGSYTTATLAWIAWLSS